MVYKTIMQIYTKGYNRNYIFFNSLYFIGYK